MIDFVKKWTRLVTCWIKWWEMFAERGIHMKQRKRWNEMPAEGSLPMRSVKPFQSTNLTQFQAKPHFQLPMATRFQSKGLILYRNQRNQRNEIYQIGERNEIPAAGSLACRSFLVKAALPMPSIDGFQSTKLTYFQTKSHFQSPIVTPFQSAGLMLCHD